MSVRPPCSGWRADAACSPARRTAPQPTLPGLEHPALSPAQSTLLDAIGGRRRLGAGVRVPGETTRIAYLTQEAPSVAGGATMLSHLRRAAPCAGARAPPAAPPRRRRA
jgi:hypothetical protein